MKLGLFTACLPEATLAEVASWAGDAGFQALELAAWPSGLPGPFQTSHVDPQALDERAAEEVRSLLARHGLEVSALAYYENNLHPDPVRRGEINAHLRACIDAAAVLGCPAVGTFIGRDPGATVSENLRAAECLFGALADHAAGSGVKLMIENCVMEGWHPDRYPGNLAYSPELWEWMFELGLYLNYDPSHLIWLGIEPVAALAPYVHRVAQVHAKDVESSPQRRARFGFLGPAVDPSDPWDGGWWRYRLPGLGQLDWRAILATLAGGGFDGVLSVEHEDPEWDGSEERVKEGLLIAQRTLAAELGDASAQEGT